MVDYSKWTLQRLFNKVYRHLLKQNAKAIDQYGGSCKCYADGKRCAWGCFLPLSFYKSHGDIPIYELLDILNLQEFERMRICSLMTSLRSCHDNCAVEEWPQQLRTIANKYNLKVPETKSQ